MDCTFDVQTRTPPRANAIPRRAATPRIGIVVFNDFALGDVVGLVELFHSANTLAQSAASKEPCYDIRMLSAAGGRIASSSSMFVWTESVDAHVHADDFHAVFIAGGAGTRHALRDERLSGWLRYRTLRLGNRMFPIREAQLLIDAARLGASAVERCEAQPAYEAAGSPTVSCGPVAASTPMQSALAMVEEDLGREVARKLSDCLAPPMETPVATFARKNGSTILSEKIQASAKWLEANCTRPISIDDAAQVATMSERNFLRRFKAEMGVTPSDYLLQARLKMSCRLLVQTDLPADKIARRCGLGSGSQLSKHFRKHLTMAPMQYRSSQRPSSGQLDPQVRIKAACPETSPCTSEPLVARNHKPVEMHA
jgi:transcriptional regulator GlxA family with amidase domain